MILREANTFSVYFGSNKSKWDKIIDYAVKKLYPNADNIVAVSKGVADDLCSELSIPKAKVTVIYNPVIDQKVFDMAEQKVEHPWFGDQWTARNYKRRKNF